MQNKLTVTVALTLFVLSTGVALAQSKKFGRTDLEYATEIVNSGRLERYDEAVHVLERWVNANPKDVAALRTLARGQAGLGRAGEADAAMAQVHWVSGDRKQALIFARRAQKALPEGSPARLKVVDVLTSLTEAEIAK